MTPSLWIRSLSRRKLDGAGGNRTLVLSFVGPAERQLRPHQLTGKVRARLTPHPNPRVRQPGRPSLKRGAALATRT